MQRYGETIGYITASQGKRRYETLYYTNIPKRDTDVYLYTKKLDRMDTIAYTYYGDVRLWIVIAKVNGIHNGSLVLDPGLRIRIPYPLEVDEYISNLKNRQF